MRKVRTILFGFIAILLVLIILKVMWKTSENYRAKNWSGTVYINLGPDNEFINITWKDESIWYLIRNKTTGDYEFIEKTPLGILPGGKIVIKGKK